LGAATADPPHSIRPSTSGGANHTLIHVFLFLRLDVIALGFGRQETSLNKEVELVKMVYWVVEKRRRTRGCRGAPQLQITRREY
jgi:hypothetical protein